MLGTAIVGMIALGCGGGGATTTGGGGLPLCGSTFSTPNYASAIDPGTGNDNLLLRWETFPVPVQVKNAVNFTVGGTTTSTNTIVDDSLTAWENAIVSGLRFTGSGTTPTSGITIEWNKIGGPPGGGDTLGVTLITYSPSTGIIKMAEVTMNYWDGMTVAEVRGGLTHTLTHELGHATFISGHSPTSTDVMYYAASTTETKTITTRDANTLDTAYCGSFLKVLNPSSRTINDWVTKRIECKKELVPARAF